MILNMLKMENVQIIDSVENWQEAIHVSLKPLLEQGYVTEEYGNNIIKITNNMGPYYIITDNVALIHARPEDGVLKKQLAVTILRTPVKFSEESSPVQLLVALAATDSESHIDVMRVLAGIFMSEKAIRDIIESKTEKQVYEYLQEYEKNEIS